MAIIGQLPNTSCSAFSTFTHRYRVYRLCSRQEQPLQRVLSSVSRRAVGGNSTRRMGMRAPRDSRAASADLRPRTPDGGSSAERVLRPVRDGRTATGTGRMGISFGAGYNAYLLGTNLLAKNSHKNNVRCKCQ